MEEPRAKAPAVLFPETHPEVQHPQVTQFQPPILAATAPNPGSFAPAAGLTSPPG